MFNQKKIAFIIITLILLVALILSGINNTKNRSITKESAAKIVSELPEVKLFMNNTSLGAISFDHEDVRINAWVIHVYENLPDHQATFNWYDVNKATGEVHKEF